MCKERMCGGPRVVVGGRAGHRPRQGGGGLARRAHVATLSVALSVALSVMPDGDAALVRKHTIRSPLSKVHDAVVSAGDVHSDGARCIDPGHRLHLGILDGSVGAVRSTSRYDEGKDACRASDLGTADR